MKTADLQLVSLCTILMVLVLLIDLWTPLNMANGVPYIVGGVPYVAVVLVTLWLPGHRYSVLFASLTSILTAVALFITFLGANESGAAAIWDGNKWLVWRSISWMDIINRALAIFAIWVTAILTILRKQSEEQTRHLGAIVESSRDAIIGLTLEGLITSWNRGAEHVYQYTAREVIGRPISLLQPPDYPDETSDMLDQISEGRHIDAFETLRQRKDGSVIHASVTLSATRDVRGKILGASEIARDITERKRFEDELIKAKEMAEEMSRLKSSFLKNMSHEIRTPLSGILGFASILAQEIPTEHHELAELIEKSGRRLLETLNSVLDLSLLESDSFVLHPRVLDVVHEVEEKTQLLRPLADEKELTLATVVASSRPNLLARLDQACLDRILNNLIGNAIKFTEQGTITVSLRDDGGRIQISVRDTGIGIADEFMAHLFDEFEQESSGISRLYEGSGLGLSITKRLVDLMNGTITVQSKRGEGSTFTVSFPGLVPLPESGGIATTPSVPPIRRNARILFVEDDPAMRTLLKLFLRDRYHVDLADSAKEALRMACKRPYDLILQDINLGHSRTGIDVLNDLRRLPDYTDVPIIAVTAYAFPQDRRHFIEAGFTDYLSKPITEDRLLDVVGRALAGTSALARRETLSES